MSDNLKYRPDIDGLRAIAVLSVIFFHMNPNWISGGFLGVDIFFVISGFLITTIIHRQISQGTFSFTEFYTRRMKRILPAFFTVVLSCIVIGYFILLPDDYKSLGKSTLSTLFFVSNIWFGRSAGGYFESNDAMPLLHTWSLAVEEQYYFIWPIILITLLTFSIKQRTLVYSLLVVALISFIGATVIALNDTFLTKWNYYLLPSRVGELLIGSILAIKLNNGCELGNSNKWGGVGVLIIFSSFVLVNGESVFPGVNALWPCLGVAFIIYSNPSNAINKMLSIKPLTYIGLISYSLYLWHWPILAFMRYVNPNNQIEQSLSNPQLLFSGVLTWLLAHITFKLVECRTRVVNTLFPKTLSFYLVIPSLVTLVIIGTIFVSNGLPSRFGKHTHEQVMVAPNNICTRTNERGCALTTGDNKLNIALLGDSHAAALEAFFLPFGEKNELSIIDYSSSNCAPAKPLDNIKGLARDLCKLARSNLNEKIHEIDSIIIVARWEWNFFDTVDNSINGGLGSIDDYYEKLKNKIISYKSQGIKKIVLVNQIPKYQQDIKKFLLPFNHIETDLDELFFDGNELINQLAEETEVFVLDFYDIFCPDDNCSPMSERGEILYFDHNHINVFGAKWLYNKFDNTTKSHELLDYLRSR